MPAKMTTAPYIDTSRPRRLETHLCGFDSSSREPARLLYRYLDDDSSVSVPNIPSNRPPDYATLKVELLAASFESDALKLRRLETTTATSQEIEIAQQHASELRATAMRMRQTQPTTDISMGTHTCGLPPVDPTLSRTIAALACFAQENSAAPAITPCVNTHQQAPLQHLSDVQSAYFFDTSDITPRGLCERMSIEVLRHLVEVARNNAKAQLKAFATLMDNGAVLSPKIGFAGERSVVALKAQSSIIVANEYGRAWHTTVTGKLSRITSAEVLSIIKHTLTQPPTLTDVVPTDGEEHTAACQRHI